MARILYLLTLCAYVYGRSTKISKCDDCPRKWLNYYDQENAAILNYRVQKNWEYNTDINDETLAASLQADADYAAFSKDMYNEAMEFVWDDPGFPPDMKRQFSKITDIGSAVLPPADFNRLSSLGAQMEREYSTARVCNKPGEDPDVCYPLDPDLELVMATSRDWSLLEWAFAGWSDASSRKMPPTFTEHVALQNEAAQMNGYSDGGAYWRSWYETEELEQITADLWAQIRPLYQQLHAFVRKRLREVYPDNEFPESGHIPAHLLGNMWAQQWNNIEELVRPFPAKPSVDVTDEMRRQNYTVDRMFRVSEEFFTSLGLEAMTSDFWAKSMLEKPPNRDVVCHASAWDFYNAQDYRIKQCSEITTEWLYTTHHEMGHIQYFQQYSHQPTVYRNGGNPGFHEAIGDVLELSVSTPQHLNKIGLIPGYVADEQVEMNALMNLALRKLAFLPFGYLIDQWRWDVFDGEITPETYNSAWWNLRCDIQGVASPVPRYDGRDFDAGAKFHVPSNVPYIRYFISHVLQFTFHEAMCNAAGHEGPLHKCSIYESKEAGALLEDLMKAGSSREWPDILEEMTGSPVMDIKSLNKYFQPLMDWLEEENRGERVGWTDDCPNNY